MKNNQRGQALLVVTLIGVIALIAVVSATTLLISELKKSTVTTRGLAEYQITYGVLENALLRLLRDPNWAGETVTLGTSTCVVTVTGALSAKTIETSCTDGNYVRNITASAAFEDGIMSVSTITEVP